MGDCARFFALKPIIFEEQFLNFPKALPQKSWERIMEIAAFGNESNETTSLNLAALIEDSENLYYLEEDDLSYIDLCIQVSSLFKYESRIPHFFNKIFFGGNLPIKYLINDFGSIWTKFQDIFFNCHEKDFPWWIDQLYDRSANYIVMLNPQEVKDLIFKETNFLPEVITKFNEKSKIYADELDNFNKFFKKLSETECWLLGFEAST